MAFTKEEAIAMVNAAEKYGRTLTIMQNRRFEKGIRALKELIRSGMIGKLGFVCADIFVPEDLNSIRNLLDKPMLQDNAIHTLDQARFLLDADPVTAYCHSFNPVGSKYRGDAAGVCIYEMSDGSVFCFRCMMGVTGCWTSWESEWRIVGSKGTALWDGINNPYCEVLTKESVHGHKRIEGTTSWDNQGRTQHGQGLAEMFQALIEGRKFETDCTDNIKSIFMVFAALESAEKAKKVYLKDIMGEG
jgi:predicted dehydrogenase